MQLAQVDVGRAIAEHEAVVVNLIRIRVKCAGATSIVRTAFRVFVAEHLRLGSEPTDLICPSGKLLAGIFLLGGTLQLTSSLILDQNALLTYRVLPFSFSTNLPNDLLTSPAGFLGGPVESPVCERLGG